jgi:colanic acid/amylovoran biosynthesis glycosyltransferase
MKKILAFNYSFFALSETFIHQQVTELAKKNSVELMAFKFLNDEFFPGDFKRFLLRESSLATRVINSILRRLFKIDRQFNSTTYFYILEIIKKNKVDVIHAHFGWSGISIFRIAKIAKVPLVVSFHGSDASAALRSPYYVKRLPELFEYATAITIVSKHMIKTLKLEKWIKKVHLIPCGVDTSKFPPTVTSGNSNVLKIVHTGRLVPKKGVPDLIRVFSWIARVNDRVILEILGDGVEMEVCRELVEKLDIGPKVRFHGSKPHVFVRELLASCDIFVLNSREDDAGDMEGVPVSLLEAMSMGKPVISTFHAGIPDVVTNEVSGLLVNEKSNDALYEALIKAIGDPTLRNYLGKNAREVAVNFDKQKMMDKINLIFDSMSGLH